jgi:two-component system cell cycle response regulator
VARRLREAGMHVEEAADGRSAMTLALASSPKVVVTDLWMPGMSGVQLCRLLGAEEATASTAVVLLTASNDPRTRFWAKRSGAVAFFAKHEIAPMVDKVLGLASSATPRPRHEGLRLAPTGSLDDRLCTLLDDALCEAVIAGEVRALAHAGETFEALFGALGALVSQLLRHRFLSLHTAHERMVRCAPGAREQAERAANFGAAPTLVTEDPELDDAAESVERAQLRFGEHALGSLVIGGRFSDMDRQTIRLIARELGGPLRVIGLIAESVKSATTDPLTGLLNRRAFDDAIQREMALCERDARPLSVLMLDVDHFKRINDLHGHGAGDDTLRRLSRLLRATARRSDLIARWGGEEFIVALPSTGAPGAAVVADRFRRAVRALLLDEGTTPITVSIGHASLESGDTLQALLARADRALYRAKELGRDRVEAC